MIWKKPSTILLLLLALFFGLPALADDPSPQQSIEQSPLVAAADAVVVDSQAYTAASERFVFDYVPADPPASEKLHSMGTLDALAELWREPVATPTCAKTRVHGDTRLCITARQWCHLQAVAGDPGGGGEACAELGYAIAWTPG